MKNSYWKFLLLIYLSFVWSRDIKVGIPNSGCYMLIKKKINKLKWMYFYVIPFPQDSFGMEKDLFLKGKMK